MENHCKPSSSLETEEERRERLHRIRSEAGRKGGSVKRPETRWFARHPELARECGKKGAKIREERRKQNGGD